MSRWFHAMKCAALLGASVVMPVAASAQSGGLTGQVIPPSQSDTHRVTVAGTEPSPIAEAKPLGPVPSGEQVQVTVFLKPSSRPSQKELIGAGIQRLTRAELEKQFSADPQSLAKVSAFAKANNLTVVDMDPIKGRVILSGTASAIANAFGTGLHSFSLPTGQTFHANVTAATVPANLAPDIQAVLGLDTRPVAWPHFVVSHAAQAQSFNPQQVASLYDFPPGVDGTGQTIAIIELGGGYLQADLDTYFKSFGLRSPQVTAVSVQGVKNSPIDNPPGGKPAWDPNDSEVTLDIEVAGALANGANIVVYFTNSSGEGFANALLDAVLAQPTPSVISISWGAPEDIGRLQYLDLMGTLLYHAAQLGITVVAASGDSGSWDGRKESNGTFFPDKKLHVDFPASSPLVLACGGTTLKASGNQIVSETVWNDNPIQQSATGGGVSVRWAQPPWQASAGVPLNPNGGTGRGVPDVSGDADPYTPYNIFMHGQATSTGGTSAVAPLWAAMIALFDQELGRRVGYINDKLYAMGPQAFHNIVQGSNDVIGLGAYSARPGWNACTGLGSPDAQRILSGLK